MTQQPTTIILFGITGDLAQKKILPALYDLYQKGQLSQTQIVGFSRREFSDVQIRDFVSALLPENFNREFLGLVTYVQGQFDDSASYTRLAEHLAVLDKEFFNGCSNKLFYLSVPPNLYENITRQISKSGLSIPCGGPDGFARILIEKPFGNDLTTAQELDKLLGELFKEEQVYRIDHYLAKESLYTIIDKRRTDAALQLVWNREHIDHVEMHLFETATVGNRGAFYDGVGALRDVGQNHVLQMLALVTMDIPLETSGSSIQHARANLLKKLTPKVENIRRGQCDGYLLEPGVHPNSTTETFFSLTATVDAEKFRDMPFVLSSGKALNKNLTEIKIHFKDGKEVIFDVPPQDSLPAYQKILLDCISGDQTLFTSTDEIMAEWAFITPIVESWKDKKPTIYTKGSDPKSIF